MNSNKERFWSLRFTKKNTGRVRKQEQWLRVCPGPPLDQHSQEAGAPQLGMDDERSIHFFL